MTIDGEDQMIKQIMADHDAAMAATVALSHLKKGKSWNARSAMRILSSPVGE
jgi:hypothetical protein